MLCYKSAASQTPVLLLLLVGLTSTVGTLFPVESRWEIYCWPIALEAVTVDHAGDCLVAGI